MSSVQWKRLPADPDLEGDLGYEIDEWDVIRASDNDKGRLMFLPKDEEMLRDDAFILAEASSVCNVEDRV
ncbi:hypothetical protein SAMN05421858_1782 [Haladaptatus litoreus]|uniref:Uncharacterized protein n=1 Tax=Haladaptatus litoreus TaxID=553468 RepID=A0A1N6YYF8_9EURY|nr:hypothetical protein [Haladaptatus litoreus]SIR19632.1 hypothetical protein SAMN05421858_1782 [Haladaptatus litoreus]